MSKSNRENERSAMTETHFTTIRELVFVTRSELSYSYEEHLCLEDKKEALLVGALALLVAELEEAGHGLQVRGRMRGKRSD